MSHLAMAPQSLSAQQNLAHSPPTQVNPGLQNGPAISSHVAQMSMPMGVAKHWNPPFPSVSHASMFAELQPSLVTGLQGGWHSA
jgi:hypothetical protein